MIASLLLILRKGKIISHTLSVITSTSALSPMMAGSAPGVTHSTLGSQCTEILLYVLGRIVFTVKADYEPGNSGHLIS